MEGRKTSLFLISLIFIGIGLVLYFIPFAGILSLFVFSPFANLSYLNFYNEVTGYKYDDDVIIEKY